MARVVILVLGISSLAAFGGCTNLGPPCVENWYAQEALDEATAYTANLGDRRISILRDGTIRGEIVRTLLVVDPSSEQFHWRVEQEDGTFEVKASGPFYLTQLDGEYSVGRDFRPDGALRGYGELLGEPGNGEFSGVAFGSAVASDSKIRCGEYEGIAAYQFDYVSSEVENRLIIEASDPHRPLFKKVIDEAVQTNYRIQYSYDAPDVQVDLDFARNSYLLEYRMTSDYVEPTGGRYLRMVVGPESEWAPVNETLFQPPYRGQTEGSAGHSHYMISQDWDAFWGRLRFSDVDSNGMVSSHDVIELTLKPDYHESFWDEWAQADVRLFENAQAS